MNLENENFSSELMLNSRQQECVECSEGALMMLAGAGAGKTKTLIAKIQFLLQVKNVSPYEILALTFSNKAAKEMRSRLGEQLPALQENYRNAPMLSTFHSFCAFILRQEGELIGLSKNFSIYDDTDSESIIKALLNRRNISTKQLSPKMIANFIDRCKNRGLGIHVAEMHRHHEPLVEQFLVDSFLSRDPLYSYFVEYQQELIRANAIDFGGLINAVIELFLNHPDTVLAKYQKRFRYILVDEYQDTNKAQFLLLYLLAKKSLHLCVVGDEDQSIYSWRGADISNILDFEKYFSDYKLIKLEQNYRSSANIINAASKVIEHNVHRKGKKMWTENSQGELIDIHACRDDFEESQKIVNFIENAAIRGTRYDDMAVLFRSSASSRSLEDELRKKRIPYRMVGGIKFYERKEVKDLMAYLKLIVNPSDNISLTRIINVPVRGIGTSSLKKIEDYAAELNCSIFYAIESLLQNNSGRIKLTSKLKSGLEQFIQLINEVRANLYQQSLTDTFQQILKSSGYKQELLASQDADAQERWNNLEQLYNALATYQNFEESLGEKPRLEGFLQTVSLDQQVEDSHYGVVSLMTVHAAKGLEFPIVFIMSAEEGSFPSYQSVERGESALEEERRLFYVAMTRAKEKLYILYARGRMLWGQVRTFDPSQFLSEIPLEFAAWKSGKSHEPIQRFDVSSKRVDTRYSQIEEFSSVVQYTYPKGSHVQHDVYGAGMVMGGEGSGDDEKVVIKFQQGSLKKFMVKFANLKKLD
jgi:DNA helicase-2/ATP-dependent DNA helicase PcrA